jgi:L-fuconolactonase
VILDAHQHVWDLERASYPWLGPELAPIDRTFGIDELAPTLDRLGIGGTVLVQAADNAEDTELMLATAAANPRVVGVVGWAPLDQPEVLEERLESLRDIAALVGIRNLTNDRDAAWLSTPEVDRGLSALERADLPLDYVAGSSSAIQVIPGVGERHPGLRIVLDHLGRPPIGADREEHAAWREGLAAVAANPRTAAKLSGLYSTAGALGSWTVEGIRPFMEDALELFGPRRLMFGGDWPICLLAGGYERTWDAVTGLLEELLDPAELADVLGGTAADFYRIDPARLRAAQGEGTA